MDSPVWYEVEHLDGRVVTAGDVSYDEAGIILGVSSTGLGQWAQKNNVPRNVFSYWLKMADGRVIANKQNTYHVRFKDGTTEDVKGAKNFRSRFNLAKNDVYNMESTSSFLRKLLKYDVFSVEVNGKVIRPSNHREYKVVLLDESEHCFQTDQELAEFAGLVVPTIREWIKKNSVGFQKTPTWHTVYIDGVKHTRPGFEKPPRKGYKECINCHEMVDYPDGYYYSHTTLEGYQSYCKSCSTEYALQWAADNPERFKEIQKRYEASEKGREVQRTASRKYQKVNREKVNAYRREYYHRTKNNATS